jgi:hypothetical protein
VRRHHLTTTWHLGCPYPINRHRSSCSYREHKLLPDTATVSSTNNTRKHTGHGYAYFTGAGRAHLLLHQRLPRPHLQSRRNAHHRRQYCLPDQVHYEFLRRPPNCSIPYIAIRGPNNGEVGRKASIVFHEGPGKLNLIMEGQVEWNGDVMAALAGKVNEIVNRILDLKVEDRI